MINEEEKFDDLLRQKMSERDFFFDEENWQKLNEKIERRNKIRKQTRFTIIFLGGLALGVLLTVPVMNLLKNSSADKTVTFNNNNTPGSTTTNSATVSQPVATNNTGSGNGSKPENSTVTANGPIANSTNAEAKITKNEISSAPAASNVKANEKTFAVNKPTSISKAGNTQVSINTARNAKTFSSNNKTFASNANNERSVTTNNRTHSRNRDIRNTLASNSQSAKQPEIATNSNTNNETANNANSNQKNVNSTQVNSNNGNQNTQQAASANTQQNNNSVAQGQQTVNNNSNTANQAAAASNKKADSTQNAVALTNKKDTGLVPMGKHPASRKASIILSADAGGGYSFGWKNYGVTEANGISPVLGISAAYFFSKKVALALGIQYNSLTNLKTSYANTVTTYDFGINTNSISVMPTAIYYIAAPLTLRYYFDDNDAVCFGGSFLYLVNTSSKVTTYSQTELNPASSQTKSMTGYTQGFNNIDLQARIAYRRKIYKSFSASMEYYFGLLDDENTFFADNTFKRNSGLRLILSYDLIK